MDYKKVQETAQKHINKLKSIKNKQETAIESFFATADKLEAEAINKNLNG